MASVDVTVQPGDVTGWLDVRGIRFRCESLTGRPEWLPVADPEVLTRLGPCIVTGGGGSIGGVLARWLASAGVPLLVADVDEDRLYQISGEVGSEAEYQLLDICDARQVGELVRRFQPQTIFHLAAKKHVRFVQGAARAAIMANAIGTMNILDAAAALDTPARVTVTSSDKASVPQNLVGLTKRTAEEIVGAAWVAGARSVRAVRLPNVLGTAGGVLDHYVREGEAGRPLDVWSADMSRYFCCVHEATHALVRATLSDRVAPLMILDVGQPVPIAALAASVARTLDAAGCPTEVVVSERFEAVHARHETLHGPDERWDEGGDTPRLAVLERRFRPSSEIRDLVVGLAGSDRSDAELEAALWRLHAGATVGAPPDG